ncbi:STAS/SEC14 domain-containing protein [Alteromonas halophila]|uniref:Uncharacterized protein n=1 Tax=Alteromonas halophila TaxID=516698 RepID=A0A918MVB1_9ALTE|nr:STAS/SEC14 domain-containing protein [Alteromonas halophila]GGW73102.1 hypothetical protein GCM10007391_00800 [Alteromonas halophila]
MAAGHGVSQVVCDGDIILVTLSGAFNQEGIELYEQKARDAIRAMKGEPFKMLIDDSDVEGGTPEAYAALDRFNQWQNTQPLRAKAFVVKQTLLQRILMKRTPALSSQNTAFFTSKKDALAWLNEQ